jgi:hypothetical protein
MDVIANKNQWGTPIRPERYGRGDTRPDSELYFNNVNPAIKTTTDMLNRLGGGSKTYPGELFDIDMSYSPETLEHLISGYFTGLGMSFLRGTALSTKMWKNEDITYKDVPVWRRFQGEPNDFQVRDEYEAIVRDLKAHKATLDEYMENPDSINMKRFQERYGWKSPIIDRMLEVEKTVNKRKGISRSEKLKAMKLFVKYFESVEPD